MQISHATVLDTTGKTSYRTHASNPYALKERKTKGKERKNRNTRKTKKEEKRRYDVIPMYRNTATNLKKNETNTPKNSTNSNEKEKKKKSGRTTPRA